MASKILVIEDDKDIRDIITFILEEKGYEVSGFGRFPDFKVGDGF